MPGMLHIPAPHDGISAPDMHASPALDVDEARAANVEYSWVRCLSPHDGHPASSTSSLRRTSFSNRLWQESQLYS
jgi:hypothetical protein